MKMTLIRCLSFLACIAVFFSCKKEIETTGSQPIILASIADKPVSEGIKLNRYFGKPVKLGDGVARSWITTSDSGEPIELGIEMTRNAAFHLPESHEEASYLLSLPDVAKNKTTFDHIVIDWNAHGHPPFFYQLPHFDFHFYMMPLAERLAIPSYAANPSGFDNNPPAGYLPPVYIAPPGGEEAQMGKHWVDATSPELPWNGGAPFTKTFIYGTYNGKVTFLEPMITQAYLQSGVSFSTAFPQPELFEKHAYYPTTYNVYKDNGSQTYNITLAGFTLR